MFTGLSAFPITPLHDGDVDEESLSRILARLTAAKVDSITVLGSTGLFAYLDSAQRSRVAHVAVEESNGIPVLVGISALRTSDVLAHVDHAEKAGAAGLLLAPMSYLPLNNNEVFELFRAVSDHTSLPVIVYDNPRATHFDFSLDLYERVASLPGIASIKIPGVPTNHDEAVAHVSAIKAVIPAHVTVGVSGDTFAAAGLNAGCDAWYSVIGGIAPELALSIVRASQSGDAAQAAAAHEDLEQLWQLFDECGGGARVVAALAEYMGLAQQDCLPRPLQGIDDDKRERLARIAVGLRLTS